MKTKLLIILFALGSMQFFGCSSDDDTTELNIERGIWKLKNVSGGLVGVNIDYNEGDVYWTFKNENKMLIVENNILTDGPESIYAGRQSGVYSYEIKQVDGGEVLYIEDTERGAISIREGQLIIDDGLVADGFLTKFDR